MNIFDPRLLLLVAKSGRNHFGYMLECGGEPIVGTMAVRAGVNAVHPPRVLYMMCRGFNGPWSVRAVLAEPTSNRFFRRYRRGIGKGFLHPGR
jgi:hypothetical protein